MKKLLFMFMFLFYFVTAANAVEVAIKWCDAPSTFEVGDILDIKANDSNWGGSDPRINPESCIIIVQISDMTLAEFQDTQWAQPQYNITDPDNWIRLRKRQFKIDKNGRIPNNVKNYINNNDGFVVFDKATINNWIVDKDGQL